MLTIILGLICILIGFAILYSDLYFRYKTKATPNEKIEYRYIPRSPKDELDDPVFPSDIFSTMFSQPDPWILSLNDLDTRKRESINKYFISGI
jgi:hypothetical protein